MNKRELITFIWSSIIFASLASGLLASVAWFASANKFDVDITGSVVEEYFHTGNGTQNNPFVITRPIHYYHLVEFFQRETALDTTAEFGTDYLYFQVGYDLDNDGDLEVFDYDDQGIYQGTSESPSYSQTLNMAYYSGGNALMPIGTNEVPFIGVFDGKADEGIVVSNLNIHCAETVIVGNNTVNRAASDIGMFGYVSDKDGSNNPTIIKNIKVDGLNIDLTDVTSTVASPTTSIAHTDAHAGVAYVGYIAGHVHSYTNYSSTGPTNATPLYNVYVTNAKIEGGAGTTCGFGYIGLVDTVDGEEPTAVESQVSTTHGSGGGQGDDWGGSIDAKSYNDWIYGLYKTTVTSTSGIVYEYSTMQSDTDSTQVFNTRNYTDYTLHFATNYKTGVYGKNGNYTSYNYYMNPDCFNDPPDGYAVRNTSGIYSTVYQFKDNNYIPLKFSDETKTATHSNNTGYIVGSAYGTARAITASPKLASYYYSSIGNSLQDTYWVVNSALTNKTLEYDDSKLEVLTYKNGWFRIEDSHNANNVTQNSRMLDYTRKTVSELGLTKYDSARNTIQEVSESTDRMHGIHFENNEVSTSNKITKNGGIKMHGNVYNDLLRGSVEFHLKKEGHINFFAGTYYTATRNFNFFSIYKVERNNGSISSAKRILRIYTNTASGPTYVYEYSDGTYSTGTAGTLVFDVESTLEDDAPLNNALYYFEVPVNEGEYAMGMVPGKSASSYTGAYMIYLDLSASGSEEEETYNQTISIADAAIFTQIDFQIDNFVTNSCFNIAFVIPEGATKETFSVTVSSGDVVYNGEDYFCYEIVIVNTTQHDFVISALLMDDDDNPNNDYFYMYAIKYNTGARTEYTSSNTYTGVSGGTTMTPTYS